MLTDKDIQKIVTANKEIFSTKEDLKLFATKEDLKLFATKDDLKNSSEETKRHFDVVAEGLKSDIKLVAEQVSSNAEKLTEIEQKIEANNNATQKDLYTIKE